MRNVVDGMIDGDSYLRHFPAKEKLRIIVYKSVNRHYIPNQRELTEANITLQEYLFFFDEREYPDRKKLNAVFRNDDVIAILLLAENTRKVSSGITEKLLHYVKRRGVFGKDSNEQLNGDLLKEFKNVLSLRYRERIVSIFLKAGISGYPSARGSLKWIFDTIYKPLTSTMFALLAFFIVIVSYRAFKIRNLESFVFILAAVVVMLGQIPAGNWLFTKIMPEGVLFSDISDWIMSVPNMAAQRAIMIGTGLAVVFLSMKIILGLEKPYLGDDE